MVAKYEELPKAIEKMVCGQAYEMLDFDALLSETAFRLIKGGRPRVD